MGNRNEKANTCILFARHERAWRPLDPAFGGSKWVDANNIEKIRVDYFGGGDVGHYLGDKWERFDPLEGPQKGWLAISVGPLQGGRGNPAPNFSQPTGFYKWLNEYEPVDRAGKSIFIYHIE